MTNNKIKNSGVILLSTIMLTSVFAFTNIPQASAQLLTIDFTSGSGIQPYTESGLTVTSLFSFSPHTHPATLGGMEIHAQGCCSNPYKFEFGGAPFTVVSVDVLQIGFRLTNNFVSSLGANQPLSPGTTVTFPSSGWTGITSFIWSTAPGVGNGIIDNLVVQLTTPVDIDIKPGSDPNCFNNDGNGVIPVAILGSDTFDVTTVNPATITLDSQDVKTKGSGDPQTNIEDVNGDGFDDLVVKIIDTDGTYAVGTGTATLTGQLFDGTPIEGTDSICVTQ